MIVNKCLGSIEYRRQLEQSTDLADRLDAGTACKDSNDKDTEFNGAASKGAEDSTSAAGKTASSSKRQKVEKLTHSFVVSVYTEGDTGGCDIIHPKVIGVFATKEIAVAHIPTFISADGGRTFREILDELENGSFQCKITDNRSDPPDNGILLKIEYPCHEFDEIRIEKFPIVD